MEHPDPRGGVERVMGFCTDQECAGVMRQAVEFERHLVRSGVWLIRFRFSVSRKEQRRRFREREVHPLKQWKPSPIDKRDEDTVAKEATFSETETADAPWKVIQSDCNRDPNRSGGRSPRARYAAGRSRDHLARRSAHAHRQPRPQRQDVRELRRLSP